MKDPCLCFNAAVNLIRSLPKHGSYKPSNELMLNFYGNYKRVMEGECNISKPWGLVAAAKWQAWKDASAFSRDEAMQKYIDAVIEVLSMFPDSPEKSTFTSLLKLNDQNIKANVDEEVALICSDSDEEFCDAASSIEVSKKVTDNQQNTLSSQRAPCDANKSSSGEKVYKLNSSPEADKDQLNKKLSKVCDQPKRETTTLKRILNLIRKYLFPNLSLTTIMFIISWPFLANMISRKFIK